MGRVIVSSRKNMRGVFFSQLSEQRSLRFDGGLVFLNEINRVIIECRRIWNLIKEPYGSRVLVGLLATSYFEED